MNFGATILDASGTRLSADEKAFFTQADPFGFILFARNIETPDQVRALTSEMRDAVGRHAPILIDQEGGRVQRLRAPNWREWLPPADEIARAGDDAEEVMHYRSWLMALELKDLGIDCNCAPLVDVICDTTHEFLRDRCYGSDPEHVTRIGRAVASGLLRGGVLPVVKHMPGHGRAMVDSHFSLPQTDASLEELMVTDFAPFLGLSELPLGMTGHVVFSALDDKPATLSPIVMNLIREELEFDGLIMTDDISMKALQGSLDEISQAALAAGCDVILHCNGTLDQRRRVADASGRMSEDGQRRAEAALASFHPAGPVDIAALEAKLVALTTQA